MATAKVVPIKPASEQLQSEKKWGAAVMRHGTLIVPSILLRAQARLLVNSTQMIVLLQLVEHWWTAESKVFPSMKTIATRIDLTPKQVQRTIDVLVAKGLLTKISRRLPHGGKASNEYRFDGLVQKLKAIEPDFDKARKAKIAAGKPGGLVANTD
jgi:DNA replication protein DnaD